MTRQRDWPALIGLLCMPVGLVSALVMPLVLNDPIGDTVAGTAGVVFSLAGVLLFWSALRLQRNELILQRDELGLTRAEMANSTEALRLQIDEMRAGRVAEGTLGLIERIEQERSRRIRATRELLTYYQGHEAQNRQMGFVRPEEARPPDEIALTNHDQAEAVAELLATVDTCRLACELDLASQKQIAHAFRPELLNLRDLYRRARGLGSFELHRYTEGEDWFVELCRLANVSG